MLIISGAVIAVLLLAIVVLFVKYSNAKKDPDAVAKATTARLIKEIGKVYDLPTNEQPTVAQVQDRNKLDDQEFFKKAQNGDYILVYTNSRLAIIYREKDNKLINVGPINIPAQANALKVAVLNGTGDANKGSDAANKVKSLGAQVSVTSTADAKNKNTAKTIVVDVTGKHSDVASTVAGKVGGTVQGSVPETESIPAGVDIVVIVGKS